MSELEELKARKKARSDHRVRVFRGTEVLEDGPKDLFDQLSETEADLDRAIAIAEEINAKCQDVWDELSNDVVEARAAVLALRDACETGSWNCSVDGDRKGVEFFDKALADTESYEAYR